MIPAGFITYSKISTLESTLKNVRICMPDHVSTEAESANKKLQIQKYPGGRGLQLTGLLESAWVFIIHKEKTKNNIVIPWRKFGFRIWTVTLNFFKNYCSFKKLYEILHSLFHPIIQTPRNSTTPCTDLSVSWLTSDEISVLCLILRQFDVGF